MTRPDTSAFALSQRNFDALPEDRRLQWTQTFVRERGDAVPHPTRIIVELANTCNLDCPICRVGEYGVQLSRIMPLERFRLVAERLFGSAQELRLNGLGETTLVPNFAEYLGVIDDFGLSIELITNGTGNPEIYHRLLEMNATLLFSWDAAAPDLFEKLRRGTSWPSMVATLRATAKNAAELNTLDNLHLLFTLQPGNETELPSIIRLAHEIGVPNVVCNVAKLTNDRWLSNALASIEVSFKEADAIARRLGVRLFLPNRLQGKEMGMPSAVATSAFGCDRPWREVVVRWNGDIQVCNMFNPYVYGNVFVGPVDQWWNGPFAAVFRRFVNSPMRHPYCEGCAYLPDVYAQKQL